MCLPEFEPCMQLASQATSRAAITYTSGYMN